MGTIVYAVERYQKAIAGMKLLYDEHWQEIALDKDAIKLDPDYVKYWTMADLGLVHVVTARVDGELVGYHMAFMYPHLHYKTSMTAITDIFYLRKKYRTGFAGYRLLKFARDALVKAGAQKIVMQVKLHFKAEKGGVGVLLRRLGFTLIEENYSYTVKG